MKTLSSIRATILAVAIVSSLKAIAQPIQLHPENPHYFLYKNKPLVLITSGEHYGAVINTAFDYATYLATLKKDGLNLTRLFTGAYTENTEAFGIMKNSLAPAAGKLLVPWARSNDTGYTNGGNKFDLTKWDDAYFKRLKDFLRIAAEYNVITELTLFSSFYWDGQYFMSPFYYKNNINIDRDIPFKEAQVPGTAYWSYQEAYVRKLVRELNEFDNLYFEIQNEPWSDHADSAFVTTDYYTAADLKDGGQSWKRRVDIATTASLEWQARIAAVIKDEERALPKKHLISQNISNFYYPCSSVDSNVAILNFHYALPQAVSANYFLNKAIAFNETGFAMQDPETYRKQAWRFIASGGAVFNNLDYSFCPGNEDGMNTIFPVHSSGGAGLRKQLGVLSTIINSLPLTSLLPSPAFVKATPGFIGYPLAATRQGVYFLYLEGKQKSSLQLLLPAATYIVQWIDTKTGDILKKEKLKHNGGVLPVETVAATTDVLLLLKRSK